MEHQVKPEKSSTQEFIGLSYGVRRNDTSESVPVDAARRTFLPALLLTLFVTALVLLAVSGLAGQDRDGTAETQYGSDYRVSARTDLTWLPGAEDREELFVCDKVDGRVHCLLVDYSEPSQPAAHDRIGVPFRDTDPSMSIPMEGDDPQIVMTPTNPGQRPSGSV